MKYVLFVDMKTISCSERDIEKILEKGSRYWKKICDNFWVFSNYPDDYHELNIDPPEHYMDEIEELSSPTDSPIAFIGSAKVLDNNRNIDFMAPQAVLDDLFDSRNNFFEND